MLTNALMPDRDSEKETRHIELEPRMTYTASWPRTSRSRATLVLYESGRIEFSFAPR